MLPIHDAIPQLLDAVKSHASVVLQAPPGAGKSTVVPLELLKGANPKGKILMLEPRRVAARSVAMRMASTLNEAVGKTVGYRTRLDTKVSSSTKIEVVTEGILTRMLQHDAALEDVGMVIFDEFHERSLQADLGLALCLDVQSTLRDDLKLLIMSATLDSASIIKLLGDAPVVTSAGKSFDVVTHYKSSNTPRSHWNNTDVARDVANATIRAINDDEGDVLVFLPGQGEIRRTQQYLQEASLPEEIVILPLYGELRPAEQDRAIAPAQAGQRKIVLSTNIAETSLTIDGVRIVIDSGIERRARFDPNSGMSALETLRISRASADQRRGRAGRTQSGVCYRLWTETEHASLAAHTPAEILEADLMPLALELANWGIRDANQLRWLDTPPAAMLGQARDILRWLGAIDEQGMITPHGREMNSLGTHPRLAHMLVKSREWQLEPLAAELAALLTERDLLRTSGHTRERDVDMRSRIEALHGGSIPQHDIDQGAKQRALRSAEQLLKQMSLPIARSGHEQLHETGRLLALAYPDRIARRTDSNRYVLVNGKGASLEKSGTLGNSEFLAIASLNAAERDARIQLATPVPLPEILDIFADQIQTSDRVEWSEREQIVVALREVKLGQLILESKTLQQPDPGLLQVTMLKGIQTIGLQALPWNDAALSLRARMQFAFDHDNRAPQPWPRVDDGYLLQHLDVWLAPWLDGMTRRTQLSRLDMHQVLLSLLDWNQQTRLNDVAPTHITVPSGSNITIDYSTATPTLSVRLQEVFGMTETPQVSGIPVLMELLSPARRPVQVTQDLASFWARGYHDVKKDLKGRYPKHYWPDDPLQAVATSRAKPRS